MAALYTGAAAELTRACKPQKTAMKKVRSLEVFSHRLATSPAPPRVRADTCLSPSQQKWTAPKGSKSKVMGKTKGKNVFAGATPDGQHVPVAVHKKMDAEQRRLRKLKKRQVCTLPCSGHRPRVMDMLSPPAYTGLSRALRQHRWPSQTPNSTARPQPAPPSSDRWTSSARTRRSPCTPTTRSKSLVRSRLVRYAGVPATAGAGFRRTCSTVTPPANSSNAAMGARSSCPNPRSYPTP